MTRRNRIIRAAAVIVVLVLAVGVGVWVGWLTNPPVPIGEKMRPIPTGTAGPTATAASRTTPTVTGTPAITPTEPAAGENLLVNGDFEIPGHFGWNQVNNYWSGHSTLPCGDYSGKYAQMDRDGNAQDIWPPGGEDVLSQDVTVPPHNWVSVSWVEAGHMHDNPGAYIEVVLSGKIDFDDGWEVVQSWPGPLSMFGAGKCSKGYPPEMFAFVIIPEQAYSFYRLEIRGGIPNPYDGSGMLMGGFELIVGE